MKYETHDYHVMVRLKTKQQIRYIDNYITEFQELPNVVPELPVNQAQWYSSNLIGFHNVVKNIWDYIR